MKNDEILNLLIKSSWRAEDIQRYINLTGSKCGRVKSFEIRDLAQLHGGRLPFKPYEVTVDSVLKLFGKNRQEEISMLTQIINAINREGGNANHSIKN